MWRRREAASPRGGDGPDDERHVGDGEEEGDEAGEPWVPGRRRSRSGRRGGRSRRRWSLSRSRRAESASRESVARRGPR